MDNAPYHSVKLEKCPTSNWRKADIIQWLHGKGEVVDQTMIIPELLEVVRRIKPIYNKYIIDEMVLQQNKTVLRLPPYHCELNPIDLVWSVVKRHVKANNKTFKLPDVKNLLVKRIAKVDFVKYTIEEENKFWTLDDTVDELITE
ncbi:DDE 3 domain-containing protein [Aphis craccivora]|uniref:DDE 3 domain-containing protein n=1 Tax=Aphis craccivora TaxID=307492 RepID=A0A6G0VK53_APHCR|nr:DDE 3 domain-containing protein [Aphis craccivora]